MGWWVPGAGRGGRGIITEEAQLQFHKEKGLETNGVTVAHSVNVRNATEFKSGQDGNFLLCVFYHK